jgi:hypothetical protein
MPMPLLAPVTTAVPRLIVQIYNRGHGDDDVAAPIEAPKGSSRTKLWWCSSTKTSKFAGTFGIFDVLA